MEALIFGSKSVFAIEVIPTSFTKSGVFGKNRIWVDNVSFGAIEDENFIETTLNALLHVNNFKKDLYDYKLKTDAQIFDFLTSENPVTDKYMTGLGEGFDDYLSYIYACDEYVYLLWQLRDDPNYNHADYVTDGPQIINSKKVCVDIYYRTIIEFKAYLDYQNALNTTSS